VLFLLFGSSGAGKTVALDAVRGRVQRLAVHDFDEIGVPDGADTAWGHRSNEQWLQRALDYQNAGSTCSSPARPLSVRCWQHRLHRV
jgi:hypothetical protein